MKFDRLEVHGLRVDPDDEDHYIEDNVNPELYGVYHINGELVWLADYPTQLQARAYAEGYAAARDWPQWMIRVKERE